MKLIKLAENVFTKVDDEDFLRAKQFKWYLNTNGYARMTSGSKIYLHQLILGYNNNIDHINNDKLDNTRDNLRICSQKENSYNHSKNKNNTSGFKGVSWHSQNNNWRAHITVDGKFKSLGSYKDKIEAAKAYNHAAKENFGEYANLNNL